jgi:DNA-directed RNA polymerase specialized sigma24 family protein
VDTPNQDKEFEKWFTRYKEFEKWFTRCGPVARAILARRVSHWADLEDLFAEWSGRVWLLFQSGRHAEVRDHEAFLAQMARNVAWDYFRRLARRPILPVSADLGELAIADPRDSFAGLQLEDVLDELRRRVGPVVADAFDLVRRLGYTLGQAAKELGRSETTIRRYVAECESIFCRLVGGPAPGDTDLTAPAQGHAAG